MLKKPLAGAHNFFTLNLGEKHQKYNKIHKKMVVSRMKLHFRLWVTIKGEISVCGPRMEFHFNEKPVFNIFASF